MIVIKSGAGTVLATATTRDALAVLQAAADVVGVSVSAHDPAVDTVGVTAAEAGIALAAVIAFDASGQGNKQETSSELVEAGASAHDPTVSNVAPTPSHRTYYV
jgi:hypothetical protein